MHLTSDRSFVQLDSTPKQPGLAHFLYGTSPAMRTLERLVAEIAPTRLPVILVGETGTGKEALALQIHRLSSQRVEAFLKYSCVSPLDFAPLYREAAKNGAGASDEVSAGTVFLDDVNQLDATDQARLLGLLPDGERTAGKPCLGARVISATASSLEEEMRSGRFHRGLCYRLDGVCLRLPALRDRTEDIPQLFQLFIRKYASLFGRREPEFGLSTMDRLLAHSWPGNVRELENVARKVVVLGDEQLALEDLSVTENPISPSPSSMTSMAISQRPSLREVSREASRVAERDLIRQALERTHWNRKRSARELQISYKALLYKLKQLGLDGAPAAAVRKTAKPFATQSGKAPQTLGRREK
jgi:two-component system response regulator AtoC